MQIVGTKVSHRKTPPGACVEFMGADGESIEVDLRGEEFADMGDADIVARAKSAMSGAGAGGDEPTREDAGLDQTLRTP